MFKFTLRNMIVSGLSLAAVTVVTVGSFINYQLELPNSLTSPYLFTVKKGQSATAVINELFARDLIASSIAARLWMRFSPDSTEFRAGTFELMVGYNTFDTIEHLVFAKEKQFAVTLVEGSTLKDWLHQLNQNKRLSQPETNVEKALLASYEIEGRSLEGWLMPETYYHSESESVLSVVKRAYIEMAQFLEKSWKERDKNLPYKSPYEALIMASIIEKETGVAAERPRIAAVFINRLRKKMRLQTDPTVIYGMGDRFDGNIRRKDLREATPYNTYVIKGLPPTPIAMPSRLAIEAALNPMETDELYFVARGDGSHYFSKNLQQHNAAVKKYQLKL